MAVHVRVNTGPYGAGIFKMLLFYGFDLISAKLHEALAIMVEYSIFYFF